MHLIILAAPCVVFISEISNTLTTGLWYVCHSCHAAHAGQLLIWQLSQPSAYFFECSHLVFHLLPGVHTHSNNFFLFFLDGVVAVSGMRVYPYHNKKFIVYSSRVVVVRWVGVNFHPNIVLGEVVVVDEVVRCSKVGSIASSPRPQFFHLRVPTKFCVFWVIYCAISTLLEVQAPPTLGGLAIFGQKTTCTLQIVALARVSASPSTKIFGTALLILRFVCEVS